MPNLTFTSCLFRNTEGPLSAIYFRQLVPYDAMGDYRFLSNGKEAMPCSAPLTAAQNNTLQKNLSAEPTDGEHLKGASGSR